MAKNELHIGVPKGYFDNLKDRLSQIPVQQRVSLWEKVRPYVALAACFAISVTAGTFLLNRTAPQAHLPAEPYRPAGRILLRLSGCR